MSYIINILNNGQYVGIPALRGLQGPQGPAGSDINSYEEIALSNNGFHGYIRFNNGLQIAYGKEYFETSITLSWGSLYESPTLTVSNFAANFIEIPVVQWSLVNNTAGCMLEYYSRVNSGGEQTTTTSPGMMTLVRPNAQGSMNGYLCYTAIGKWK